MTDLGPQVPPPAPQPAGAWAPPQASEAIGAPGGHPGAGGLPVVPARKRVNPKKLIRLGVVAVAAVVGIGTSAGWFGDSAPKVGDCVHTTGATSFDVVDCGKAGAEYKIAGIDATKRTYDAFQSDDTVCAAFANSEEALWVGDDKASPGTVYCAEPI
jgi:hypothetical protein